MKVRQLDIQNFLTIGEASVRLSDKGLVLLQGENRDDPSADSNGAGKSSVPDALCWALFGKTARGLTGDAIVNLTAGKGCYVGVEVEDAGEVFHIVRNRKNGKDKNRLVVRRGADDLTKGTDKLTQELVEEIVGCSYEVFSAAIYAGQDAMPDLPAMTDKQLKVLVEEAAGINRVERAYEIARQRYADATRELDVQLLSRDGLEDRIKHLKDQLEDMDGQENTWREGVAAEVKRLMEQAHSSKLQAHEAKSLYDESKVEALRQAFAELQAKLDAQSSEQDRERELEREAGEAKAYAEHRIAPQAKSLQTEVKRLKDELEAVETKVGSPCGECGRPYTESELRPAKERLTEKLDKAQSEFEQIKRELAAALSRSQSASKRLEEFRATRTDVSEVIALQRSTEREIAQLEAHMRRFELKKEEVEGYAAQIQRIKAQESPYTKLREKAKADIDEADARLREVGEKIADIEANAALLKAAVEVFGPAGVRAHILDTVTPFLNDRTEHYLNALSDGNISAVWTTIGVTAKGELREKFNIEVKNSKGADSFAGLSGGEKRKVRLSAAMALQDLVGSRATKPIELFIADEVDHALDEAGLERLMMILDEKAKSKGTVLVISHNELADWCRQVSTVVKEGGVSTIEGVLV